MRPAEGKGTGMGEKLARLARAAWQALRDWSGDAAYDHYVRAACSRPGAPPLTRGDFYVQQLDRRYSKPTRCC